MLCEDQKCHSSSCCILAVKLSAVQYNRDADVMEVHSVPEPKRKLEGCIETNYHLLLFRLV